MLGDFICIVLNSNGGMQMAIGVLGEELLTATLDKGPRCRVQWNWAFLLVKSFKLVPRPLDKGPGQIKLWFSLHGIIVKGNPIGSNQKKKSFKESSWFR